MRPDVPRAHRTSRLSAASSTTPTTTANGALATTSASGSSSLASGASLASAKHHHHQKTLPPLTPAVSGVPQQARPLRAVVSRALQLHPEDESDNVLAVVFALLERAGNRAMSVKELGEAAFAQGYLRTSPSAAGQAIGTHIRNHIARHVDAPWTQLLSSYKLEGGTPDEEARIGGAVYCTSLASCRRGTTVWYMSKAAGKLCPFQRIGVSVPQPVDPSAPSGQSAITPPVDCHNATAGPISIPASSGVKRKIPLDEAHDGTRPSKIRIILRLPPRKPIPKRPRPINFPNTTSLSASELDSDDESSSGSSSSDEEMLVDDFSTLLATDVPITIPCPARAALASSFTHHRRHPSHHHHHHRQTSLSSLDPASFVQQFFDTCEPPPDSEDDDDDFHNSMLRPDVEEQLQAVKEELDIDVDAIEMEDDELLLHFKNEEFFDLDIKEEELATPPPVTEAGGEMTAHPELDWSGVKVDEGAFSPLEMLIPNESSLATALQTPVTATPFIQTPLPLSHLATARAIRAAISRHSSISAPPPTPWIKTEEDPLLFPSRLSPEGLSILEEDELASSSEAFFPNPSTSPDPVFPEASTSPAPVLPSSEVDVLPPWESETWTPIPGPESVSTDDVDSITYTDGTDDVTSLMNGMQASTSAPSLNRSSLSFPIPATSRPLGANGRAQKPPRLSMSTLTTFNKSNPMRANPGHARRHSHAAGVSTSKHRRLSVISTAFSDWTNTGTPEETETPAPLATPSHTGWRIFPWPPAPPAPLSVVSAASEGEDKATSVEKDDVCMASPQDASPTAQSVNASLSALDSTSDDELHRCLSAPTFNQVLQKTLPAGVRISTLLLLGIPVFQCRIESPPVELIRRMDTDHVNISTIMSLAQHLAQATATRFRSNSSAANTSIPGASANASVALPTPPPAEELPPNHIFINSGARVIHGGWVSLPTARSVVKNYHDLPPYIRRVFLADQLAEKFPEPIRRVKAILTVRRTRAIMSGQPGANGFGKPFANPSSLSAHELLVSVTLPSRTTPRSAAEAGANLPLTTPGVIGQPSSAPVATARGAPLALKTKAAAAAAAAKASFPLSPIDAVTNANVQLGRVNANGVHHGAIAQQSIMSLTDPMGELDKPWTTLLGKTMVEPKEEEPLKPEEEEILKAILKSPPRSQMLPNDVESEADDQEMCVDDEQEEEEVARGVVDLSSDVEREQEKVARDEEVVEEEEPTIRMSTRATRKKMLEPPPPKQVPQPQPTSTEKTRKRNLRHAHSVSSASSDLTVSESESSAPPPSLDSRPALKGKSTNHPLAPAPSSNAEGVTAAEGAKKPTAVSLRARARAQGKGRGRARGRASTTTGSENGPRVRIIEVEEPSPPTPASDTESSAEEEEESAKPRRSERIAKPVHPTSGTANRAIKRAALKEKSVPVATSTPTNNTPVEKGVKLQTDGTRTRGKRATTPGSEAGSERSRRRQAAVRH